MLERFSVMTYTGEIDKEDRLIRDDNGRWTLYAVAQSQINERDILLHEKEEHIYMMDAIIDAKCKYIAQLEKKLRSKK